MTADRMLFVNLPVRDLGASRAFFEGLGFSFEDRFCDDKAICLVLARDASYAMLLTEPFFDTFIQRGRCDTSRQCEGLFALSCGSRDEVDAMTAKAVELGGQLAREPQDMGFMYSQSFLDLDGHQWELLWMDVDAAQAEA